MFTVAPLVPSAITLDDFVALNDEIAALARAGVPLGKGLLELGSDVPGRLGKIAAEVGRRLEQGETLEQVVAGCPDLFPPAYRAVIAAGIKVGRLPAALEGISHTARRTAQMRRSLGLAMIYPLFLVATAYVLLGFWMIKLGPVFGHVMRNLNRKSVPVWDAIAVASDNTWWWGPGLLLLLLAGLTWQWWRWRQVARGVDLHPLFSFGALWRLWKMRECTRLAAMTDMLSLLTAYGVPLPQAVVLAGDASGDNRLKTASHDLAQRLARGEPASAAIGFPPLLAWVLGAGSAATDLAAALRRMGDTYRDEAQRQGQWLMLFVPLVMTVLIGGTAVALVATVYFGPFVLVLYQLIEATSQVN